MLSARTTRRGWHRCDLQAHGRAILVGQFSWTTAGASAAVDGWSILTGFGRGARRRVLHVFVEPAKHLVNKLFVRLHGRIPVRLVREQHQASRTAVASNCLIEFARLYWRGTGIRVFRAVHDQKRCLQFVGKEKRGDFLIDIRCFPNRSPLVLETERRERLVIGAAGSDTGPEQVGVGRQICGH